MRVDVKTRRALIVLFALMGLCLAALLYFHLQSGKLQDDVSSYIRLINRNVHKEIRLADAEWQNLRIRIANSDNLRFSTYTMPHVYAYYIYRNAHLDYWSESRMVPDGNLGTEGPQNQVVNIKGSYYIALRRQMEAQMQTLDIYQLIPLFTDKKIQNKYIVDLLNERIFPLEGVSFVLNPQAKADGILTDPDGVFLTGLKLENVYREQAQQLLLPTFVTASVLVLTICLLAGYFIFFLIRKQRHQSAFFFMLGVIIALRLGMLLLGYPYKQLAPDLFDPSYYASSLINPSMGDFWVNCICILLLVLFLTNYHHRMEMIRKLSNLPLWLSLLIGLSLMLLGFRALYFCYHYVEMIYQHSAIAMDITANIHFDLIRVIAYLTYLVIFVIYFLINHVFFQLILKVLKYHHIRFVFLWVLATILTGIGVYWFEPEVLTLVFIQAGYVLVLYLLNLPRHLNKVNFGTFSYLIIGAVAVCMSGADAIQMEERKNDLSERKEFASRVLLNEDPQAEFLLADVATKVRNDVFIQNQLLSPFGSKEVIPQKIKRVYLGSYFDKYDVDVYLFNSQGDAIETDLKVAPYVVWRQKITTTRSTTGYQGQYFIRDIDANVLQRYVQFVEIPRFDYTIGYIIIDLKLKRIIPNSVYPELLVDQRFLNPYSFQKYSYAVYNDRQLQFDAGSVNYRNNFDTAALNDPRLYGEGLEQLAWHHIGLRGVQGENIVISSPRYPSLGVVTNFSLLFLLVILFILLLIIVHAAIATLRGIKSNYATRIQIFLNLAFFIPLFVVSLVTLSLLSSTHRDNVINSYYQIAENIRRNIAGTLDDYISGNLDREVLANRMSGIASYATEDLSLYNTSGKLLASSQPEIFNQQLLSKYINPRALMAIREQGMDRIIFSERVGSLKYRSAYISIRSEETGRLIGILNLPFFESNEELDREMTDVTTTILNVFTFIFLLSLLLSWLFSRTLAFPLELITQKIRKTSLSEHNEPLEWNSEDEIGLMVGAYNKMLENLEDSKRALAQNEKESAWREMAKQVAHEIKNPLTPMKLTLQHMQRIMGDADRFNPDKAAKQVGTLLNQIDTLSDIATSFSSFAKMPTPKNERFDIAAELRRTIELYNHQQEEPLSSRIKSGAVWVQGDRKLFGRIFTNLILNAKQAVSTDIIPDIRVTLLVTEASQMVSITVRDNGGGIPEDIQSKVFIPNFSTKSSGSGIGLAVAKRGVEHAGGKIWFDTNEEGTTFHIELPLADAGTSV